MGIDLRNMIKGNIANPNEMYKSLNIFFDQLPQMKLLSINQISIVYNVGISVFIFTKKPTLFFVVETIGNQQYSFHQFYYKKK